MLPSAAFAQHVERDEIVMDAPIRFDIDSDEIRPESFATLDALVALLSAHPELGPIRVEGHMSPETRAETAHMSRRLWHDRAEAVHHYLVARGVAQDRVSFTALETDRPVCDPSVLRRRRRRACWRQNDRIVIRRGASG